VEFDVHLIPHHVLNIDARDNRKSQFFERVLDFFESLLKGLFQYEIELWLFCHAPLPPDGTMSRCILPHSRRL
jgi:hypothetical protein